MCIVLYGKENCKITIEGYCLVSFLGTAVQIGVYQGLSASFKKLFQATYIVYYRFSESDIESQIINIEIKLKTIKFTFCSFN